MTLASVTGKVGDWIDKITENYFNKSYSYINRTNKDVASYYQHGGSGGGSGPTLSLPYNQRVTEVTVTWGLTPKGTYVVGITITASPIQQGQTLQTFQLLGSLSTST